jgi:hypothetical protein
MTTTRELLPQAFRRLHVRHPSLLTGAVASGQDAANDIASCRERGWRSGYAWRGFADSRPIVEPRVAPVYLEAITNVAWKEWTEDNKAKYLGQLFQ